MDFIDNYGHVFSMPSYNKKPIGYQYEENRYIFWINDKEENKLSINNYYVKIVNLLLDRDNLSKINITCESERFKLMKYSQVKDSIDGKSIEDNFSYNLVGDFNNEDDEDILCINLEDNKCIVPIYIISTSNEEGSWYTNILIHISYKDQSEEYSYITVGGVFVDECEQLIINGRNFGIDLPKDIIKAVYQGSYYNEEFNTNLYNEKLKEYLMNYIGIKGELGNFNSIENSLKWFGWNNHISISKLLQTDNQFKNQFIRDYFDIKSDLLKSFNTFRNSTYISLKLELNKELEEENLFDFNKEFWGEGKPKLESLIDKDIIVESEIKNSLKYIKKYYDYSFSELGLKLCCLKYFLEKYFLPIHLSIYSLSMNENCFANDIKFVNTSKVSVIEKLIYTPDNKINVKFPISNTFYFNKQIHFVDENLNEFNISDIDKIKNSKENIFYINDTCVNIPISFEGNNKENYFNCNLILEKKNKSLQPIQTIEFNNIKFNYNSDLLFIKNNNIVSSNIEYSFRYDNNDIFSSYYKNFDDLKKIVVYNSKLNKGIKIKVYKNEDKYFFNYIDLEGNLKQYEISKDKEQIEYINIDGVLDNYIIPEQQYIYNNDLEYFINVYPVLNFYLRIKTDESNIDTIFDNDIEYTVFKDFNIYQTRDYEKCFESSFSFIQSDEESIYKNFIIYPKVIGKNNDPNNRKGEISYWVNEDFKLSLLVNNKWYYYDFTCKISNPNIKLGKLKYQYWDNDLKYTSRFNQINDITEDGIKFNSFMYNTNSVIVNNINFKYDYIKYSILHNLKYIDGSQINDDDFYQIIVLNDQKIFINRDYYGKDFSVNYNLLSDFNKNQIYIYIYNDITFIIYENEGPDGSSIFIINENQNNEYNIIGEKNTNLSIELNANLIFKYDQIKNVYNVFYYYDNEEKPFGTSKILDILHSSKNTLMDKYIQKLNIPTNNKSFLNNIHLFNIYRKYKTSEYLSFDEPKILVNQRIENGDTLYDVNLSFLGVKYGDKVENEIRILGIDEVDKNENIIYEVNQYSYVYFTDENKNLPVNNIFYIDEIFDDENNIYPNLYCEFYISSLQELEVDENSRVTDIKIKSYRKIEDNKFESYNEVYQLLHEDIYINKSNNKLYIIKPSKLCGLDNSLNYEIYSLKFKTDFYIKQNKDYVKIILNTNNFQDFYYDINNPKDVDDKYKIKIICYQPEYEKKYSKINKYPENQYVNEINGEYYGGLEFNGEEYFGVESNESNTVKLYKRLNTIGENEIKNIDEISYNKIYKHKLNKEYLKENKSVYSYILNINYFNKDNSPFKYYISIIKDGNLENEILIDKDKLEILNDENNNLINNDVYLEIYMDIHNTNVNYEDLKISYSIEVIYNSDYELFKYDTNLLEDNDNLTVTIDGNKYKYGQNKSKNVIELYKKFFEKIIIYQDENGDNPIYLWDQIPQLKLNTYLEYDFYLMHDNQYWYGIYISKDTIDKCIVEKDLNLSDNDKVIYIDDNNYKLEYVKSDNRFLINRMKYIDSEGVNHFNNDDLIVAQLENNDKLPVNIFNGSKWIISPISIRIPDTTPIESNSEMCILSLPKNNNEYYKGYYDVTVRYSLDRFSNQQFLKTTKLLIK